MSRPANSFLVFCKEKRKSYQKENSHLSNSEISSMLGKEWREMSFDDKQPYINRATVLKKVSMILF